MFGCFAETTQSAPPQLRALLLCLLMERMPPIVFPCLPSSAEFVPGNK